MRTHSARLLFLCLAAGGLAVPLLSRSSGSVAGDPPQKKAVKESPPSAEEMAFFDKEVLPLLKANCYKCHADGKARGGLSLADRASLLKGGETGPAISLERPEDSLLLRAINHRDELKMPPASAAKLSQKEIDILTRWVKAGAPGLPAQAIAIPKKGPDITEQDRSYWAYQPVKRPEVPVVKDSTWAKNPIDAFILSRLEAKGLSPAAPADRLTLVRRAYYDLIGLPPTPEEVDAFVKDNTPDAYERLIDKLLASPHYGEKWARHWLDLVRYGETNGYEFDQPKPFIWRYRDYVIDAFNQDKPYDEFVREQIAGDLLGTVTAPSLIATGYFRVGQWDSGAADRVLQKYEVLDNILSTTGQVFLGMSLGCARCHDHKKDPILQRDYYRLLAFFHNISDPGAKKSKSVMLSLQGQSQDIPLKDREEKIQVSCVVESGSADTHVLIRGNPQAKGDRVDPGFPEVLVEGKPVAVTGGRSALAKWLTDPKNPLTARVMVNRLWQHHFGRGIVPTPNDFGKIGEPPTHPELLDWLASEFVAGGWKMKQMHRLLMTSNAYRMSSKANKKGLTIDPGNALLWHFNMRRLTAEEVRDSILAVSGRLNPKMAGQSIYPPIPKEVLAGQARPGAGWKTSPPQEAARRSVYVHIKRSLLVPILAQFDQADTDASCPVRFTTTVPTQALGLLNDEFSNEEAKVFAQRLMKEAPQGLEAQVSRAIRLTTGRIPGADEVKKDVAFVRELQTANQLSEMDALRFYCLMVLNTNEFIYLD
jgi:hypothetical protein